MEKKFDGEVCCRMELTSDEEARKKEIATNFYFGVTETLWSIFIHHSTISLRRWEFKEEAHELCTEIGHYAAIELLFRLCSVRRKLLSCACSPANSVAHAQSRKNGT